MNTPTELLSALDNEEVRAKICEIVSISKQAEISLSNEEKTVTDSTQLTKLKAENQELRLLLEKRVCELKVAESAKQKAENTASHLQQEVLEIKNELEKLHSENNLLINKSDEFHQKYKQQSEKLKFYQSNFSDDINVLYLYKELSEQTCTSLSGIFKDLSVQGLMACGVQEKNISNLWDYVKGEVITGKNKDLQNLVKLFEILFKRFTLAYPMFSLQQVDNGDGFDTQSHIKHNSSTNTSGTINSVLLKGYVNTKNNKVIKPSIVVI